MSTCVHKESSRNSMARIYPLPTMPQVVLDLVNQLYRIRDYHELIQDRPAIDPHPTNAMLQEQYDELWTIKSEWFNQAKVGIRNIRGVRNVNPLWTIDTIEPPEPDPIDQYYYDAGSFYYTKDPNPKPAGEPPGWNPHYHMLMSPSPGGLKGGGGGVTPLKIIWPKPGPPKPKPPWPPWPPPPPFPPAPTYWRPPAEEAYSYVYAYYYLVDYYVADLQPVELDFQYWGFHLAELLKNYYAVDSFWLTQKDVSDYLMPYISRLNAVLSNPL